MKMKYVDEGKTAVNIMWKKNVFIECVDREEG